MLSPGGALVLIGTMALWDIRLAAVVLIAGGVSWMVIGR